MSRNVQVFLIAAAALLCVSGAQAGLVGSWVGDDLGDVGSSVATWTDTVSSIAANTGTGTPVITATGFNGHKAVSFDGVNDNLRIAGASNPLAGLSSFSVAVVFNSTGGLNGGHWYSGAGLVDSEQPGWDLDWGMSLQADGKVAAGLGCAYNGATGDADATVHSATGYNDGKAHVAIYNLSGSTLSVTVDGATNTLTGLYSNPRNTADLVFGSIQTNLFYLNGAIAQVDLYNAALSSDEIASVGSSLKATYVPEPCSITMLTAGLIGLLAYAWRKRK